MSQQQEKQAAQHIALEIVSPDKTVLSTQVTQVILPGSAGDMTILADHFPVVSHLTTGIVEYKQDDESKYCFVGGGIVQVKNDTVSIIAPSAEKATEIDHDRAHAARQRAQKKIEETTDQNHAKQAQAALERAQIRIALAELIKQLREESE